MISENDKIVHSRPHLILRQFYTLLCAGVMIFYIIFCSTANSQSDEDILAVVRCEYSRISTYAFNHPEENVTLPQTDEDREFLIRMAIGGLRTEASPENACLYGFQLWLGSGRALNHPFGN